MVVSTDSASALSHREREILAELPGGATYHAIARRLGLSKHTVDTYIRRIRDKTGAVNRTEMVVLALRLGEPGVPVGAGAVD
ncbi:helix-turn-helix transcriptional regulator [Kitasatospora sp. NPDC093558]|uniref:helix-turn-helix transcriptional regulator n=1 Tax=Kitasatospora sp. NPDC093558 TaxID=3155201 RepID=UPI00343AAAF9